MTSIGAVLCEAASQLATLPQASPHLEAELLLCDATGLDRVKLLTWPETEVDGRNLARFRSLVQRRLAGRFAGALWHDAALIHCGFPPYHARANSAGFSTAPAACRPR